MRLKTLPSFLFVTIISFFSKKEAYTYFTMKAMWNGKTIAESDQTIEIEGNQYFPPDSIKEEYFEQSNTHTTCPWKGLASYYHVVVDDKRNEDAAWYYPIPKEGSIEKVGKDFTRYVAFWNGVTVE